MSSNANGRPVMEAAVSLTLENVGHDSYSLTSPLKEGESRLDSRLLIKVWILIQV